MNRFITSTIITLLVITTAGTQSQKQDKSAAEQIPGNVLAVLKAKFPKPEIVKWTKEKEEDIFVYDIEFKQGENKFEADIKENGDIHNWEQAITMKELPTPVKLAVERKYPKSRMDEIMRINAVKNGKDELEGYEIVLTTVDKKDIEVTVAPDGKILEDSTDKK